MFELKHYRRHLGSESLDGLEFDNQEDAIKYIEDNTCSGKIKQFWDNNTTFKSPEDHVIITEI